MLEAFCLGGDFLVHFFLFGCFFLVMSVIRNYYAKTDIVFFSVNKTELLNYKAKKSHIV